MYRRPIILQKQTFIEKEDLWLPEGEDKGRWNWMKVVKGYKISVMR